MRKKDKIIKKKKVREFKKEWKDIRWVYGVPETNSRWRLYEKVLLTDQKMVEDFCEYGCVCGFCDHYRYNF